MQGSLLPCISMVAQHAIEAGTELTFAYGAPNDGSESGQHHPCLCGTSACLGFLPLQGP